MLLFNCVNQKFQVWYWIWYFQFQYQYQFQIPIPISMVFPRYSLCSKYSPRVEDWTVNKTVFALVIPGKLSRHLPKNFWKPPWGLRLGESKWTEGFRQNNPTKNKGKGFQPGPWDQREQCAFKVQSSKISRAVTEKTEGWSRGGRKETRLEEWVGTRSWRLCKTVRNLLPLWMTHLVYIWSQICLITLGLNVENIC